MRNNHLNTNKQFMIGNGILAFAVLLVVVIFVIMSMRLQRKKERERRFLESYTLVLERGFEGHSTSVYLNDSLLMDSLLTAAPCTLSINRFSE